MSISLKPQHLNEENKFAFYEAMEKFLEEHLHPESAAASGASTGSH